MWHDRRADNPPHFITSRDITGPSHCPRLDKPHSAVIAGTWPAVAGRARKDVAQALWNCPCAADGYSWGQARARLSRVRPGLARATMGSGILLGVRVRPIIRGLGSRLGIARPFRRQFRSFSPRDSPRVVGIIMRGTFAPSRPGPDSRRFRPSEARPGRARYPGSVPRASSPLPERPERGIDLISLDARQSESPWPRTGCA
jgi:hypothetical protein